jgi:phospholipid/cholesterol/gamma-HCH transport system permease protein
MIEHAIPAARRPVLHSLGAIGRFVRVRAVFVLTLGAFAWGVLRDAASPRSWRRTVRAEFWRELHEAAAGELTTALVAAALTGLVLVSQAIYWFGLAGQQQLANSVLATILIRDLTPLLIGMVLLGRSGTVAVAEIGALQLHGQLRILHAQGLDPLLLFVLPRTAAFAVASFSLAVLFVATALLVGFFAGIGIGNVHGSFWKLTDDVLAAMHPFDFAVFFIETLLVGALVALTSCVTGLLARPGEDLARLLPRAFNRGAIAVMLTNLVFDLAG